MKKGFMKNYKIEKVFIIINTDNNELDGLMFHNKEMALNTIYEKHKPKLPITEY